MGKNIEVVYGLFNNMDGMKEHYWHLGVCLSEDEAYKKFKEQLDHGFWIGEIKVIG